MATARVEPAARPTATGHPAVRVRTRAGTAVACWRGDPAEAGGERHIEWSVDEDLAWGRNARRAPADAPADAPVLARDGDRTVFRGRLRLTPDGAAVLEVDDARLVFDLAGPPPPADAEGAWVEVRVAWDAVGVWPYAV
ncbi:hypothetical protein [Streptomyces sp. NPDC048172]|uniref:hypothetical protein n=1 Tax=Streptomyces sp. NPDC048172 TaxID=3365505 RepID=UPI003713D198